MRERLETIFREQHGRIVATLIRILGDVELAEEALQDTFARALEHWQRTGLPDEPAAWIQTTARNRAIDAWRARRRMERRQGAELDPNLEAPREDSDSMEEAQDLLRLTFLCCHPALGREAQIALTLRLLGGLTTPEIARAFLVSEPTLAQRLVRAKQKIREACVPYRVPPREQMRERLDAVLTVLYLIFNEGYAASGGTAWVRRDLCQEAIRLGRMLLGMLPDEPEVLGLLALMRLHDARALARQDADGLQVLLEDQDRSLWDREAIAEGQGLLEQALGQRRPGIYQVQAAIAALHCEAENAAATDWEQIAALYDVLAPWVSSPVVELNRAVAHAMAHGPARGLELLRPLENVDAMEGYLFFHSTRADFLRRLGRLDEARAAYTRALELAVSVPERRFLEGRLGQL
ncbi:MAG: RNA polymerase sigma factor [Planctomycetes bacterium]|nr:RNA polymerase sigma factor [Planctomycetota bacterium]